MKNETIELSKLNEKNFTQLENERKFETIYDAIDKWSLPTFKQIYVDNFLKSFTKFKKHQIDGINKKGLDLMC